MANGNKFTETQLLQLGFHKDAEGQWSKDSIQNDNTKPQKPINKSDERSEPLAEKENKGCSETGFRYRLIIHSYRTHSIDFSNISVKQIEDCLSGSQGRKKYGLGIYPDDSIEFCDQPLVLQTKVKKGEERTEIEVLRYRI